MINEAIMKLAKREDIGYEMAKEAMDEIMEGRATEVQKSAYLTAFSMKGETALILLIYPPQPPSLFRRQA